MRACHRFLIAIPSCSFGQTYPLRSKSFNPTMPFTDSFLFAEKLDARISYLSDSLTRRALKKQRPISVPIIFLTLNGMSLISIWDLLR